MGHVSREPDDSSEVGQKQGNRYLALLVQSVQDDRLDIKDYDLNEILAIWKEQIEKTGVPICHKHLEDHNATLDADKQRRIATRARLDPGPLYDE